MGPITFFTRRSTLKIIIIKKSKIAAVPKHVPLEALYLVVGGLIVPPKENAVCTAAILDFFRHVINA